MKRRLALAIDVGGTKIAAAVVDREGRLLSHVVLRSPTTADAEEFFAATALAGRRAIADAGGPEIARQLTGIGCGCGGPMRWPQGDVGTLNIPAWRDGFPLRERLRETFGHMETLVHNDAVALAAGEHWKGAGQGTRNLLCVTVSTGVGGGFVLDGRLFHGQTGNAGHFGHICVAPQGPACTCGGRGCVEAIASGPNAVGHAVAQGWSPPAGGVADGRTLAVAAEAGDRIAAGAVARSGAAVGLALASCANLLDLEMAVIAGGFSRAGDLFWRSLNGAFVENAAMDFAKRTALRRSDLSDSVYLLGAAAFVVDPNRYGWHVE